MKRILLTFLSAMLLITGILPVQTVSAADSSRKLWATVGDNNMHLMPDDYDVTLRKFTNGAAEVRNWSGWAWKNDHANLRLDFLTLSSAFSQAELVTGDLTATGGAVIKKENVKATYLSTVNTLSKAYPNIDTQYFDVISHDTVRDLAAGQIHEAWVDIYVPENTKAGTYKGKIALKSGSETLAEFSIELEVVDLTLTNPEDWETYLELWTTPFAANRYYSGLSDQEFFKFTTTDDTNPYSLYYIHLDRAYEAAYESQLEYYHQAGGNTITVHIVEGPDNSREPCATPSMVKWTKKKDGHFVFDYTDMDYWIELNLKHGINKQINLHSLIGVGYMFVYYDESLGRVTNDGGGGVGSARWAEICREFLSDLIPHLEKKGWFDLTCLYMDERTLEWTTALLDVADSVKNSEGKSLKVGGAVNACELEAIYDRLADISIWENEATKPEAADISEIAKDRQAKGLRTTLYSCGAGKMATTCHPSEAAYAVYDAYKYNVDGIMRWALDKFDADPLYGTLHTTCYPGDCYLIYPDEMDSPTMQAQSSPRFEKLCEGMRDVEKLRLMSKMYPEYENSVDLIRNSLGFNLPAEITKMRTKILTMSRAAVALNNGKFTDIENDSWYMPAVRFATSSGLLQGISETEFAPDIPTTRAMFVCILARLDNAKLNSVATSHFIDVPDNQWYTSAVVWAANKKIVNGKSDKEFAPEDNLTREETATLLYRYAQNKKYDTSGRKNLTGYKDYNNISSYALDAISWANAMGIMNGVSNDRLDPRGSCTRAQIAKMLQVFSENVVNQ